MRAGIRGPSIQNTQVATDVDSHALPLASWVDCCNELVSDAYRLDRAPPSGKMASPQRRLAQLAIGGRGPALVSTPVALIQRHRDQQAQRPNVQIAKVEVGELSPWSSSCELQFVLINARGGVGVLKALRLSVLESGSITEARPVYPGAPNAVRQHRVELKPGVNLYDIRARMFSVEQPPLHFPLVISNHS